MRSAVEADDGRLLTTHVAYPAPEVVVLSVLGEVDLSTVPVRRLGLHAALATEPRGLVLDMTGVTFFSVAGLRVLDELATSHRHEQLVVRLVAGAGGCVHRELTITQHPRYTPSGKT